MQDLIKELENNNAQMNKKQSHPVWPESTSQGELRTKEGILEIVECIEQNGRSQLS